MTIIKFENTYIGVTCQHVLAGYREAKEVNPNLIFQVGETLINPVEQLIAENKEYDLTTFNLTSFFGNNGSLSNRQFIEPISWGPGEVVEGDILGLAGFPGIWREDFREGRLRFYSFSSGTCEVESVFESRIATRLKMEECIIAVNEGKIIGSLGGMSGGPVFCWRKNTLLRAELVGFIYEYQEDWDLMFIRSANVLNQDGTFN